MQITIVGNNGSKCHHGHQANCQLAVTGSAVAGVVSLFTNVSQAVQNNLAKIYYAINDIYAGNSKLKLGSS